MRPAVRSQVRFAGTIDGTAETSDCGPVRPVSTDHWWETGEHLVELADNATHVLLTVNARQALAEMTVLLTVVVDRRPAGGNPWAAWVRIQAHPLGSTTSRAACARYLSARGVCLRPYPRCDLPPPTPF